MSSRRFADGRTYLAKGFNVSTFYEVLADVVASRKTTWRLLARETGVRPATLKRIAKGGYPDAATLAILSAWANLNPADFVVTAPNRGPPHSLTEISNVLKSDPNLEPAAARDLETIIYLAYASFRQQHG
jgi:transcriptional regulator with XRE-family HTH domain